tara:strand:+ start:657 stop:938 length:282 start_codon:yes stop_codon:yes gene_type:complete
MTRTLREAVAGYINLNGGIGAGQTAAQLHFKFMDEPYNYDNSMYDHIDSEFGFLTVNKRAKIERLMRRSFFKGYDEGICYMSMLDKQKSESEV